MTAKQLAGKQKALRVALKETSVRVGRHLANEAARASAAAYLEALLGGATRKNGWQLAEAAGLSTPYRFQHLLGRARWEADAVRDEHRGHVLDALGQGDAVLATDETGFVKQGKKSVGVTRQYCGASGKIDNCQVGARSRSSTLQPFSKWLIVTHWRGTLRRAPICPAVGRHRQTVRVTAERASLDGAYNGASNLIKRPKILLTGPYLSAIRL